MALLRSRRRLLPASLLAAAALVLAGLTAPPTAAVDRPDLTVTKGSVRIAGDQAQRVKGRFTVRNAGSARAGTSTAYVEARAGGKWRYLTELRILALGPRKNARYEFRTARPDFIGLGSTYPVRVCLDVKKKVREAREGNNCLKLGKLRLELLEDEVDYEPGVKFFHRWDGVGYYGIVPEGYDDSHSTPVALFVWLHGCGGYSEFDIESFAPDPQDSYVMVAPTGAEGDCWSPPGSGADEAVVSGVIEDVFRHFAINPDKIVLGGYSSGGDLSYRYAYHHSDVVEAVLVANSAPFQDTGLNQAEALAAATTKFRVVHLAHLDDDLYRIADVRNELQALRDAGFSVVAIEREGSHYDDPGAGGLPGTDADIRSYLIKQVDP